MSKPKAFVIAGDGVNCDYESEWALSQSGFDCSRQHVSTLLEQPKMLKEYKFCVIPGGFSYGDEIASGKVLGLKLKERLDEALHSFVADGNLLIGICNGFQVLVQMGLLPDSQPGKPRSVSLMRNRDRKFVNRWVTLTASSDNGFFRDLGQFDLPIRHGEGRLALSPPPASVMEEHDPAHPVEGGDSTEALVKSRAPLRYNEDINGSFDRIAALVNEKGNVMGMMPHPEAFVRWTQHPQWTGKKLTQKDFASAVPPGLKIFQNAFKIISEN